MIRVSVSMRAIVHENLMRTNEKNTNICLLKNLKSDFVFIWFAILSSK